MNVNVNKNFTGIGFLAQVESRKLVLISVIGIIMSASAMIYSSEILEYKHFLPAMVLLVVSCIGFGWFYPTEEPNQTEES